MPIGPVANRTTGGLASEIITPPITRLLDLAASQGRLEELESTGRSGPHSRSDLGTGRRDPGAHSFTAPVIMKRRVRVC